MLETITGNGILQKLRDKLQGHGNLIKDFTDLFAFGMWFFASGPVALGASVVLFLKACGSTLSLSEKLIDNLLTAQASTPRDSDAPFEKFDMALYVLIHRAYLLALDNALNNDSNTLIPRDGNPETIINTRDFKEATKIIAEKVDFIKEAELVKYVYNDASERPIAIFRSYTPWLASTLELFNASADSATAFAYKVEKDAHKTFRLLVSKDDKNLAWLRNYIYFEEVDRKHAEVRGDLSHITQLLEGWEEQPLAQRKESIESWKRYREQLKSLPDSPDSMYDESFGVRKVFVSPEAYYHIARPHNSDEPQHIKNIATLFGQLLSTRVPKRDLIILCGGPGSGKSTLCRLLASSLAVSDSFHPIFLRLRRCKEASQILNFIEESLISSKLLSKISDLRNLSNVVIILDGFDELVMASRQKLHQFFTLLLTDIQDGVLSHTKVVVAGRDTLFPKWEGLPRGSHVISINPFDQDKVKLWGQRWCALHQNGPGASFHPETFYDDSGEPSKKAPLHHLVTQPLTLHLVARVYTSGKLVVGDNKANELKKAYLYRSILAEAAVRQREKTHGDGRFSPDKMRPFVRALAWEMYSRSVDSLEFEDAVVALKTVMPQTDEQQLSLLIDTSIVSAPELQKGEDKGFEFVHKSFAEFLVAEYLAERLEKICKMFQEEDAPPEWRMSDREAVSNLSQLIGFRVVSVEVQEMLEPILGAFSEFSRKDLLNQIVESKLRALGLINILSRMQDLFVLFGTGKTLKIVHDTLDNFSLRISPFEAYANVLAGLAIIGAMAANELNASTKPNEPKHSFRLNTCKNSFWRFLSVLHAGGINFDHNLADRISSGISLIEEGISQGNISDLEIPFKPNMFTMFEGYQNYSADTAFQICLSFVVMEVLNSLRFNEQIEVMRTISIDRDSFLKIPKAAMTFNDIAWLPRLHRSTLRYHWTDEPLALFVLRYFLRLGIIDDIQYADYRRIIRSAYHTLTRDSRDPKRSKEALRNWSRIVKQLDPQIRRKFGI